MRNKQNNEADLLDVVYYTDPLCCWSWAFEPQWRRFLYEFKEQIRYRYCMGGLLPKWKNYNDSVNSVTRPIQMGPVWMHAKEISGMPIDFNIWMRDPPASSYPACIAVKCAALQSAQAEENYLRLLREALMINGENISTQEKLFETAESLLEMNLQFDIDRFKEDFKNDNGLEAFRKDLQEIQYHHISRFPTLVIKNPMKKGVMISGYRPYSLLTEAVNQISDFKKTKKIQEEEYKSHWPFVTERELQEIR
jgi:predicted DsbA family dithiol-disulfide isomerase